MTLPICEICAKTGVLCPACEAKLEAGKITEVDVELSKQLFELSQGEIGFERAIETKNNVIILAKKEDVGRIIGKGGDNIRKLSQQLGRQVKVVGTGNIEDTIYDLIAPARVAGINTVYKPDGSTGQRVRIDPNDKEKLRIDLKDMERLVSSIARNPVEITFE